LTSAIETTMLKDIKQSVKFSLYYLKTSAGGHDILLQNMLSYSLSFMKLEV